MKKAQCTQAVFTWSRSEGVFLPSMPKYMEEDPEKRTCATYEDDNDFALLVCSISALAYVPEVDIPQAFYDLQQKI